MNFELADAFGELHWRPIPPGFVHYSMIVTLYGLSSVDVVYSG